MNEILNQKYGVEVEMYNITRAKAAYVVCESLTRLTGEAWTISAPGCHLNERKIYPVGDANSPRAWKIESDASIRARNRYEQTELVSPVLTWEQMPLLQQILRDLRAAGAKSDPAHQCGVHVHVDGAGHTARSLLNLTNSMASHEQLLIGAVGIAPERMYWCQTVDQNFLRQANAKQPRTLDELRQIWYAAHGTGLGSGSHYDQSRYHMLNLHSFFEGKGVEFRLFQFDGYDPTRSVGRKGGLHAGQLKAYVQLCLAMNYRALHTRAAKFQPLQSENQRYTMRCWLLRLGFIGDEFATARQVFTNRLPGDTAWRNGRPTAAATTSA